MPKLKFTLVFALLLIPFTAGCQAILPTAQLLSETGFVLPEASPDAMMEESTAEEPVADASAEEATADPTIEAETAMTETAMLDDTETVTTTDMMTTDVMTDATAIADDATITETTAITDTPTVTETADTTEPVAEEAAPSSDLVAVDTATILVRSLRVRAGPGTEFDTVGGVAEGERYEVAGQAFDCQWYRLIVPGIPDAWIAGGELATIDGDCTALPVLTEDDTGAADAGDDASTTTDTDATDETATDDTSGEDVNAVEETTEAEEPAPATLQPTPTPAPVPEPAPTSPPAEEETAADPFPADKGCLLLQNQLGPELTFTFTGTDGAFSDTITVSSDADEPYCLDPGTYRVTVDAPPPWGDINDEFTVAAGDRFFFPIRPQ